MDGEARYWKEKWLELVKTMDTLTAFIKDKPKEKQDAQRKRISKPRRLKNAAR